MTLNEIQRLLHESSEFLEQAENREGDYLAALSDAVVEVRTARDALDEIVGSKASHT